MLAQQITNGLLTGLVYALLAIGLNLSFSTTRIVNFAHGEMFAMGSLFGLVAQRWLHAPFVLCALGATAAVFLFAFLLAYFLLWRLDSALERSVATIATSIALRDGFLIVFGSDSLSYLPVYPEGAFHLLQARISYSGALMGGASLLILAAAWILAHHTRLGIRMRATAQDEILAATAGINTHRTQAAGFALGCALAAAAGTIVGPAWQVNYAVGIVVGLKAFTAATGGGLGSPWGALAGGLLLGVAESLISAYVSSTWRDAWVFAGFLALLVLLPRGLLSRHAQRVS